MTKFTHFLTILSSLPLLFIGQSANAIDSYRYLHVTIDTPWSIFLFLLLGIFAPFVLMAILIWRYSVKHKADENEITEAHEDTQ